MTYETHKIFNCVQTTYSSLFYKKIGADIQITMRLLMLNYERMKFRVEDLIKELFCGNE